MPNPNTSPITTPISFYSGTKTFPDASIAYWVSYALCSSKTSNFCKSTGGAAATCAWADSSDKYSIKDYPTLWVNAPPSVSYPNAILTPLQATYSSKSTDIAPCICSSGKSNYKLLLLLY